MQIVSRDFSHLTRECHSSGVLTTTRILFAFPFLIVLVPAQTTRVFVDPVLPVDQINAASYPNVGPKMRQSAPVNAEGAGPFSYLFAK